MIMIHTVIMLSITDVPLQPLYIGKNSKKNLGKVAYNTLSFALGRVLCMVYQFSSMLFT